MDRKARAVETMAQSDAESAGALTERVSDQVSKTLEAKIAGIETVMRRSHILALNASIEAARAGAAGTGFSIIATEMREMSQEVSALARSLQTELGAQVQELRARTRQSVEAAEDQRLVDLSLNAIELMDRNLYERSCDVRWWATDAAAVDCCTEPDSRSRAFAARRLNVILNAYTVYLDIWLCDTRGRVLANGRPSDYRVNDIDVSQMPWFRDALATRSGDEFVCANVERNEHLGGAPVATYAAAVRANAEARGNPIGVIGIHFNWEPQARAILQGLRLSPEERADTRAMLIDGRGRILASSDGAEELDGHFLLRHDGRSQGCYRDDRGAKVGFALTPGYETYEGMGWYGCLVSHKAG